MFSETLTRNNLLYVPIAPYYKPTSFVNEEQKVQETRSGH